jgi:hypothetical protein
MFTKFIDSIGIMPEVEEVKQLKKKKLIKLANGSTRVVFDNTGHEKSHCRYCGYEFENCSCSRTNHVWNNDLGCCDICLEPFQPNGTGPANNKLLHKIINISWFNRWVRNISNRHDIGYFEGFNQDHKDWCDSEMLVDTNDKIDKTWYLKPKSFWKKRAWLNEFFVDKFGDSSFNWSGCVVPESVCNPVKKDISATDTK